MNSLFQAFQEGGWAMYLVLLTDGFTLTAAMLGLVLALWMRGSLAARAFAVFIAAVALAPPLIGVAGYFWGISRMDAAIANVDPEYIEQIRAVGTSEAMQNIWLGTGSLACTLPAAALVLAAAFLGKRRPVGAT